MMEQDTKWWKSERAILIGIFLFSLILRIMYKNDGLFHFDSLADTWAIERAFNNFGIEYSYAYGAPGMVVLGAIVFGITKIFGAAAPETAYFILTFVTAALDSVLLYLIVKKISNSKFIGIASGLLLAVNPVFLSVTTYPKTPSIAMFFSLLSIYMIQKYVDTKKQKFIILSGLSMGYALTIRPFEAFYFLPLAYIYSQASIKNFKLSIAKYTFSIKNALSFAIPCVVLWYVFMMGRFKSFGGFFAFFEAMGVETRGGFQGLFSSMLKQTIGYIHTNIGWLGWILFALGLYVLLRNRVNQFVIFILWFAPTFFYLGNISPVEPRFIMPVYVAVLIVVSYGIYTVYKSYRAIGIILLITMLITTFMVIQPVISYRHDYSGTKGFAEWVAQNTEPNAQIMTNDLGFFIRYYGDRSIFIHPRPGEEDFNTLTEFNKLLDNYTENGYPVYATGEGFAIDPDLRVRDLILSKFNPEVVGQADLEVYQGSELQLQIVQQTLIRLVPKNETTQG